ncbi:MAG: monovalent cation/H(+) antiporter subunit G [Rhodospirillaceae bacterium]
MELILDIASIFFLFGGVGFLLVGAFGVIRMPDFYTRMHAASLTDTSGAGMILIGAMFQTPDFLLLSKLVIILLFVLLTGPVATHALAGSALTSGLKPRHSNDQTDGHFYGPVSHLLRQEIEADAPKADVDEVLGLTHEETAHPVAKLHRKEGTGPGKDDPMAGGL